ncbi:MAG: hypothetical protein EBS36_07480, partial [Actinobacteria bacterium]|nr:hypothetical protein [Actinomycetota bacterium]
PADALFFQQAELRYKKQPIWNGLQLAPVDTTFAFYHHEHYQRVCISGARMVAPYEVRHLPYYITKEDMNADWEFRQYLDKANHASTAKKIADGLNVF